ncbi:hypothetical protein K435DRAFT_778804 [Dendrothele bispora CBS 962.96]|uniref:Uncharacterized protein n=1 Tax=Dendrothele bispora (strain CBS 962.96) TaxID=1314807 RepID=A0A4S8M2Q7_DENBC|nr:hypothetical protein K435DRAFT_778804 [Dendrothele bispora CBS 962.96]
MAFQLFPAPSPTTSVNAPSRWPGANQESTEALKNVLSDNHEKYHIFFDERGRHNHIAHHVVALWALGAPKAVLEAAYEECQPIQRPRGNAPEPITKENFNDHLGDHQFYAGYLEFFEKVVRDQGAASALQEYVFSPQANFQSKTKAGQVENPEMLDRFLAAIMHPMIHIGYGLEFGLPGLIIEGLALTAAHRCASLIPRSLFEANTESLVSRVQNTLSLKSNPPKPQMHAFSILSRILRDPQFKLPKGSDLRAMYGHIVKELRDALFKFVNDWAVDTSTPEGIQKAIEEVQFVCTLLYAVPGYREPESFNADFLFMHFVTSALFLPTVIPVLPAPSQELLLRSYFAVILSWWIVLGRPNLDIPKFFSVDTAHPTNISGSNVSPADINPYALPNTSSPFASNPNPWTTIVSQALVHPDDHLIKLVRALVHYANLYGTRSAGEQDFASTELDGADKIDGSLFIRTAGLTMKTILEKRPSRDDPKEYVMYWDREGYFTWSEKGVSVY